MRMNVVTASIDHMNFLAPVYVGDLLILDARINCTGRTSMEVEVNIKAEDLGTGEVRVVGSSYLTMGPWGRTGGPWRSPPPPSFQRPRRRRRRGGSRRGRSGGRGDWKSWAG